MTIRTIASSAVLVLALSACESGQGIEGSTIGTLGGAAGGALIGSQFGSGTGQLAATAIGTLVGALAGREVGRRFGDEDQREASVAERRALARNETTAWNNPQTGYRGSVDPMRTYTNDQGQLCRDYTHTIFVDGQAETARGTACQHRDGTWQLVS